MGIEVFFSTLTESYGNIIKTINEPAKIKATYLFIDFNSIVHTISANMISKINQYLNFKNIEQPYTSNPVSNYENYINIHFENLLINQIKIYLHILFTKHFQKFFLKLVYIAIDGVPSMAKMAEQKKRRYMGKIINNILDEGEELKFNWSKGNITPGTNFMKKLNEFFNNLKNNYEFNLEISDSTKPGEGETKIVRRFKSIKFEKDDIKYIFSPDSDVVLLCLLLHSTNIFMYRNNQQESKLQKKEVFNIIDIERLSDILNDYVKENIIDEEKRKQLMKREILDNIVFIFSLFGDDFLPRLESINTNLDFKLLIHTYILVYLKKGNMIKNNLNGYILRHKSLSLFFYLLNRKENDMLQRNYFSRKYYNYRFANSTNFDLDIKNMLKIFTEIINDFNKKTLEEFVNYMRNNKKLKNLIKLVNQNKYTTNFYGNFINNVNRYIIPHKLYKKLYISNPKLLSKKSKETKLLIEKLNIQYFLCINDSEFIEDLLLYFYLTSGNLPLEEGYKVKSNKKLNKRIYYKESEHKMNNYHKNILKEKSNREKKQYYLDRKLDDIYIKFNVEDKSYLKADEKSKDLYYKLYFQIDKNNKLKTEKIVVEYLKGIVWIFNHYYKNSNDLWWHYPHYKTPLLSEIVEHYKLEENNLSKNLNIWNMEIEKIEKNCTNFFTPLEQLLYVSAFEFKKSKLDDSLNYLKYLGNKLKKIIIFIEENKDKYFIDVKKIQNNILNFSSNNIIDCTISHFISKCHISNLLISKKLLQEYIKKMRSIISLERQNILYN